MAINGIWECAAPGCTTMTRTAGHSVKDYPNTTVRMPGAVCVACYKAPTPPCTGCGAALRVSSVPAELAPGTKSRYAGGMCKVCWFLHNPRPDEEPLEPISPEKLAHTIKGLEAYMERRRKRIGAMV